MINEHFIVYILKLINANKRFFDAREMKENLIKRHTQEEDMMFTLVIFAEYSKR